MKKLIFILTIFISSVFADAKIYTGASYGVYNESFFSGSEKSLTTSTLRTKIGYGLINSYALELSLEYTKNKENIFSETKNDDGDKIGINVDLIKAFDLNTFIIPFIKTGFGFGNLEIKKQTIDENGETINTNKLSFGSFNLGIGSFIPVSNYVDIELGYQYKYLAYENFNSTIASENRGPVFKSHVSIGYIGFNVRF